MHCAQGNVHVKLLNVASVFSLEFNLFYLHAVTPKCSVIMDGSGVHMLGGSLSFVHRDVDCYVEATRVVNDPISAAVLTPGKITRIDINDLHVSLAHFHAETLRKTARQTGTHVVGEFVPCAGCSQAKQREEDGCPVDRQ